MDLYNLNDEDIAILRELVAEKKNRRRNSQNRSGPVLDDVPMAPEVYLVRIPSGGIAGADSGSDTGTGGDSLLDDVFSSAICTAYRSTDAGIPTAMGLTLKVFNFSGVDIPGNSWAVAQRDKWGRWCCSGAAGITQNEITFDVVTDCSFDEETCIFTKTVSTVTISGYDLEVSVT